jgi:phosphatidylserine/phosphatidylglycerophosphate/cardiolipin synthase-like enzyme
MPALTGGIPVVANAEPMDAEAFEKTLDRITGTRNDTGKIKFLVDGDEYFGRLLEALEDAEKSIDIRTYIFDNDDFAVAMADYLRERSEDVRGENAPKTFGSASCLTALATCSPARHTGRL